jgi:hypothetical protein
MSVRRQRLQKWLVGVLAGACVLSVVLSMLPGPATATAQPGSGGGLLGVVVRFFAAMPAAGPFLVLMVVAGIPTTLIHELGHAVAARRLLGGDVGVRVGDAAPLATLRMGRITADINALATPGRIAGEATVSAARATARDMLLIALAGPAASLAQFALCAPLYAAAASGGLVHDVLWMVTAGGAGTCVLNLVPLRLNEDGTGRVIATDGRLALDALRARPEAAPPRPASAAPPIPEAPADDDVGRARRLAANAPRSVPPPT